MRGENPPHSPHLRPVPAGSGPYCLTRRPARQRHCIVPSTSQMNLATAAAVAPRPSAPRSADRSDGRFQRAIATCADDTRYRDLPVDWWDERGTVWRPTAVIRAGELSASLRRDAEVLVP